MSLLIRWALAVEVIRVGLIVSGQGTMDALMSSEGGDVWVSRSVLMLDDHS